ncbi:hypothetical protein IAE22_34490, partial [Bacillus sp. S34]|nr:hypothetical protein [Bacillus sp. S34]
AQAFRGSPCCRGGRGGAYGPGPYDPAAYDPPGCDGGAGCWVADPSLPDGPVLVPGFAVEAVDTNGAGDAHGGVLVAALSRGELLLDAVR